MKLVTFGALFFTGLGQCPMKGTPSSFHPRVPGLPLRSGEQVRKNADQRVQAGFVEAVEKIDWDEVKADLAELYTSSQEFFPADYDNYAPLFIRLAWHASGSYRKFDGQGGADGGRQRFDPERSWDDNTNLDKARRLLEPVKAKYGVGLSWGDLIVLSGTYAIEFMGGPSLGFCAGRVDDFDAFWSQALDGELQRELAPCEANGECTGPLGASTVGLIYVNPEGPQGNPDPALSALDVREVFSRMGFNDTETVALVGGGHAFGKLHGPCPDGPGLKPSECESMPWAGNCGTGVGDDTFTSGFEGPWTTNPTEWDNQYFTNLAVYDWERYVGPGGHVQWRVANQTSPQAPAAHNNGSQDITMLTADVSFKYDPASQYQSIVWQFHADPSYLDEQFAAAWYKLTTRAMGPATRCVGPAVPVAQEFQYPLPEPVSPLADFAAVKARILQLSSEIKPLLIRLAYQCSATFRRTDYRGGCNGARIRFSPEADWPVNAGLDQALDILEPIKAEFGEGLSWSDLIVLAGSSALEEAVDGELSLSFCPGRTDALDGRGSEDLEMFGGVVPSSLFELNYYTLLRGLTSREVTALIGAGLPTDPRPVVDNTYFSLLLDEEWTLQEDGSYESPDGFSMNALDMVILENAEYKFIALEYAQDGAVFLVELAGAWTKMMTNDRFDGPVGNICDNSAYFVSASSFHVALVGVVFAIVVSLL